MKYLYAGFIQEGACGDNNYALLLVSDPRKRPFSIDALAGMIESDLGYGRKQVSTRYAIADAPIDDLDVAATNELMKLEGDINAEYQDCYSEITGYLWTDENLKIGGHDLLAELRSCIGKYLLLEIIVHA